MTNHLVHSFPPTPGNAAHVIFTRTGGTTESALHTQGLMLWTSRSLPLVFLCADVHRTSTLSYHTNTLCNSYRVLYAFTQHQNATTIIIPTLQPKSPWYCTPNQTKSNRTNSMAVWCTVPMNATSQTCETGSLASLSCTHIPYLGLVNVLVSRL